MARRVFVGIDLSITSTGLSTGDKTCIVRPKKNTSGVRRLRSVVDVIERYVLESGAYVAVVEGPSFHSQGRGQHDRAGLHYLTLDRLDRAGIPYAVVPPTVLKKYATGKGNANKDAVLIAAIKRFPQVHLVGNDESDALWLAAMGYDWSGKSLVIMPVSHRDALEKVEWPAVPSGVVKANVEPLNEWRCPACGAVTRARMADHIPEKKKLKLRKAG